MTGYHIGLHAVLLCLLFLTADRYFRRIRSIRGDEPRDVGDPYPGDECHRFNETWSPRVRISVKYACSPRRFFTITQKLVFLGNILQLHSTPTHTLTTMFRFSWMMLMACAGFAIISCASRPVDAPFHDATKVISAIVHEGHRFNHSVVTEADYPQSFRPQDIHEIARSLEPEELRILARSLDTADLEIRQVGQVVKVVAEVIEKVFNIVKAKIEQDKAVSSVIPYPSLRLQFPSISQARSGFTQHIISEGMKNKPGFNWIICHTKHHYTWNGARGKDWNHEHKEFDVSFGKTIGYVLRLHPISRQC